MSTDQGGGRVYYSMTPKTPSERIAEKMKHFVPREVKPEVKIEVLRKAKGAKTYVVHAEALGNNQVSG